MTRIFLTLLLAGLAGVAHAELIFIDVHELSNGSKTDREGYSVLVFNATDSLVAVEATIPNTPADSQFGAPQTIILLLRDSADHEVARAVLAPQPLKEGRCRVEFSLRRDLLAHSRIAVSYDDTQTNNVVTSIILGSFHVHDKHP